jgi:PAS domain S-box-containing protein
MNRKDSRTQPPASLQQKEAEAKPTRSAIQADKEHSSTATEGLIHTLQVHQIELSMQNQELRASRLATEIARDRYAALYDFAPIGYFVFSADARIVEVNLTGAELLAEARENLRNRSFHAFTPPKLRERLARHIADVLQSTRKFSCELTIRRQDGTWFESRLESVRVAMPDEADAAYAVNTSLFDITELKQAEKERTAHTERFNELSRRLAHVQEMERKRLSAELHDRTSPNLAAISLKLARIAETLPRPLSPALEATLEDLVALVDDTTVSIREISTELRPPVLDYAGLLPAIDSLAQQFGRRTGIAVIVDGAQFLTRPAPEHESLLFRIASEALANCAKHADADAVHIVLANEGQHVVLTIADDGVGFDEDRPSPSGHSQGQGMNVMRERAELAGGSFSLESGSGRGTRIEVKV